MPHINGWYSKRDVIKDISKATGAACDLDEEYVVVGEQPPPFARTIDDEQELHLLRLYGGHKTSSPSNMDINSTPDYKGITEMLRMVDQYNEVPDNSAVSDTNEHSNRTIVISKLNPNVSEFVPNSSNRGSNYSPSVNSKVDLNVDSKNNVKDKKTKKTETCDVSSSKTCSVGTSSDDNSEEMQEMRQKLKSKINDASDTTCVKVKKERNLAIAMLIKLHTQPNEEEKPKLMTPDYYTRSVPQVGTSDNNQEIANLNCNLASTKSMNQNDDKAIDLRESVSTDSPVYEDSNNSNDALNKHMMECIRKVDNWFNSKVESETKATSPQPTAYFGPIKFKRKINNKPLSPASVEFETKIWKENDKFVPSTYASELTRKYEERNKMAENVKQDIWTKLEKELKAKDEIIMKKRLESNQV